MDGGWGSRSGGAVALPIAPSATPLTGKVRGVLLCLLCPPLALVIVWVPRWKHPSDLLFCSPLHGCSPGRPRGRRTAGSSVSFQSRWTGTRVASGVRSHPVVGMAALGFQGFPAVLQRTTPQL